MRPISFFPRVKLGLFPTPLHKLENLSRLTGYEIYLKRDDMTGVSLGGNKVRKLEFLLADALEMTPPPVVSTVPLKLFYASLAGIRPPKIKLFVNRADAAADNYLVFLKKQIRKNFSLEGIPLALEVSERPKKIESIRTKSAARPAGRKNKKI